MNFIEYSKEALKTESKVNDIFCSRIKKLGWNERLEFGLLGLLSELYELELALKVENDKVNIKEEIGDVLWYIALLADELGVLDRVNEAVLIIESILTDKKDNIEKAEEKMKEFLSTMLLENGFEYLTLEDLNLADISRRIKFYFRTVNNKNKQKVERYKKILAIFLYDILFMKLFYLILINDFSVEQIMKSNLRKLEKRYPNKTFEEKYAENRDKKAEREMLENEEN